jgi:hypothetical protein
MPTSIEATDASVILGSTSLHTPCQALRLITRSLLPAVTLQATAEGIFSLHLGRSSGELAVGAGT